MEISQKRKFSKEFKAKVALESLQERSTIEQLCKKYTLHASQINQWKKQLKDNCSVLFASGNEQQKQNKDALLLDELYKQIGLLQVSNEFLKKKLQ